MNISRQSRPMLAVLCIAGVFGTRLASGVAKGGHRSPVSNPKVKGNWDSKFQTQHCKHRNWSVSLGMGAMSASRARAASSSSLVDSNVQDKNRT